MAEQILDLNTVVTRPVITIDGSKYEILSPGELSIVENHRFALWGQQIQKLVADEDKGQELSALVDQLARKITVGVPDDVYAKLHGIQKFDIVEVFTMLLLRRKADVVGAIGQMISKPETLKTGAASSPDSSDSSEDRRNGGSSKHQSQS